MLNALKIEQIVEFDKNCRLHNAVQG